MARKLEGRQNEQLRAVTELELECRREQDRGLLPLTRDEKETLHRAVADVRILS